jgi:gas vesicle protein
LIAKAESSAFTIVACKTCSKTTKVWNEAQSTDNIKQEKGNSNTDDVEDDDAPILLNGAPIQKNVQDKLSAWKEEQKAGKKKLKNKGDEIPDRAEHILEELNNLAKRIIEEPATTNATATSSSLIKEFDNNTENSNISNWYLKKIERDDMLRAAAIKLKAGGNDGSNKTPDNNGHGKGKQISKAENSNEGSPDPNAALSGYNDRNNNFYFGCDKVT